MARGLAHGERLREDAVRLVRLYLRPTVGDARAELLAAARKLEQQIPPAYVEEMRGVAAGAAVSYDDVLLANTLPDLLKVAQCTVVGMMSDDDEPVVARNLDYFNAPILAGSTVVTNTIPESGLRHAAIGFPLLVGVYSGMNEAGLTIAAVEVYGGRRGAASGATPYGIVYREILDTCRTIDEAIAVLQRHRIVTQQNVVLADEREVAVVQYDRAKVARVESVGGTAFAINAFVGDAAYNADVRFQVFQERAQHLDSVSKLEAFLRETALPGMNVQSILFYPRRRAFSVASGAVPAAEQSFVDYILPFWSRRTGADWKASEER